MNRRGRRGNAPKRGRGGGKSATFMRNWVTRKDNEEPRVDDQPQQGPSPKRVKTNNAQPPDEQPRIIWSNILPGFNHYYSKERPPQLPDSIKKIQVVADFLTRNGLVKDVSEWDDQSEDQHHVPICVEDVLQDIKFCESWNSFSDDLSNNPVDTITLWSSVAHKVIVKALLELLETEAKDCGSNDPIEIPSVSKIVVGFAIQEPVTSLQSIKAGTLGKFVMIQGTIIRAGNIRPYCVRFAFRCKLCDEEFAIEQLEGNFTPPNKCKMTECENRRATMFEPLETSSKTVIVDARRIKVQENQSSEVEMGNVPRTIYCELFGALVTRCNAGDAVCISGIVRMSKDSNYGGEQSLHNLYIEASGMKQKKDSERTMGGHFFSFTNKDYYAIKAIHDTPNLFKLLIASFCPSIFGHEIVKAGIVLCLFGGTPQPDGLVTRRSDINMLMIGDPGIGKSQMLKIIDKVAPKAVYVCGTGSTVAGLTVTLVKDGNDYSLETGALVLADKGVCCIDEFDKMTSQHHALLEALEQQSVTIAKAGVFRTIPARASVIAAANPVGGHYRRYKSVNENIKINPPLLSRFDLIYILLDNPNRELDAKLANRFMDNLTVTDQTSASGNQLSSALPAQRLIDRVKTTNHEVLDLIPHVLMRKFIAYAKMYVYPRITSEAAELLKRYFLQIRQTQRDLNSTPVTARQLEALVRLTEARAKLELREEATFQDASDAIEIFDFGKSSVIDTDVVIPPATGMSNLTLGNSSSTSRSSRSVAESQARQINANLQEMSLRQSKTLFSVDEVKTIAMQLGILGSINPAIQVLNNAGILLKKGPKTFQFQNE